MPPACPPSVRVVAAAAAATAAAAAAAGLAPASHACPFSRFADGQNYFICITPEEAQRVIEEEAAKEAARPKKKKEAVASADGEPPEEESEEEEDEEPYVPPASKPWVSLGSEAEIEEEAIVYTRERFVMQFVRKRREFGLAYRFSDRDAIDDPNAAQNDCRQYKDPSFELRRKELHVAVQAVPVEHSAKTQTNYYRSVNKALQHASIDIPQKAKMQALDSAAMSEFLHKIRVPLDEALQQNEIVDVFADEFADLADEDTSLGNKADSDLKELQSYFHLSYCGGRLLTAIQWQSKAVVATAGCRTLSFDERVQAAGRAVTGFILLWNFSDPINPQYVLEAPADIFSFKFCPSNADVIIAGLETGQVALYNLAEARAQALEAQALEDAGAEGASAIDSSSTIFAKPSVLTAVDTSHRKPVTDLIWMSPTLDVTEKGKFKREESRKDDEVNMFISVAGDGTVGFWDLRKSVEPPPDETKKDEGAKTKKPEGWAPTFKMPLLNPDGGYELSPSFVRLDMGDEPADACRLYMATEEGELAMVELIAPASESNSIKGVRMVIPAHTGPCVALQRSPFMPKIYLTLGDWTFNVWMDGVSSPLFVSPFCSCCYTCGAWSPSRPAVLFLARQDGNIDVWDLNDRSHEPSMVVIATPGAITSMEFHVVSASRQLLAIGDDQGTVHVMDVPRNMRRAVPNEKQFAINFFLREHKRVAYVHQRAEIRKAEKDAGDDAPVVPKEEPKEGESPEDKLEAAFMAVEEAFKERMDLNPPPAAPAAAE